jgi:excinuclease UvrABC ATPase subunit
MRPIVDSRISFDDGWLAQCCCGKMVRFTTKNAALKMLARGRCRYCNKAYTKVTERAAIYQNNAGKWCSTCSGCGKEQAYTRKDHATQSELSDWQCKQCVAQAKGFSSNKPVGDIQRLYNRFRKCANSRQIPWELKIQDFENAFTGKCGLTGWDISIYYRNETASLDRIDSKKPYLPDNIQWVHKMVNMTKNKYSQAKFVDMCKAVANKVKW